MGKQTIYAHVKDCELNDSAQLEFIASMAHHNGKDIEITIQRRRKRRSLNQNQYYWGVVVPAIRHILVDYGNDVDDEETHSFLKEHVGKLTSSVVDSVGRRVAIVKSSAALTTAEFEAYLMRVVSWAAQEGIDIPPPNSDSIPPIGAY